MSVASKTGLFIMKVIGAGMRGGRETIIKCFNRILALP